MSQPTYKNFEAIEDSGSNTHTLLRKSRRIIITNDSNGDLGYKFNVSENFGTLKSTETLSLDFIAKQVITQGSGAYRIWSYG